MKYTVEKGEHAFKPDLPLYISSFSSLRGFKYQIYFDESIKYKLNKKDQLDWNKGGGISFRLFSNNKDSAMWAWRWNPNKEKIELSAYSNHIDMPRGRIMGQLRSRQQVIFTIDPFQETTITLEKSKDNRHIKFEFKAVGSSGVATVMHPIRKAFSFARRFHAWFGGNQPAPRDINLMIDIEEL